MIDKELIEKRFDVVVENMNYLRGAAEAKPEEFTSNYEKLQATKHSLQEAIEACIDTANHIIAAEGLPRAEEYSQMFKTLGEKNMG